MSTCPGVALLERPAILEEVVVATLNGPVKGFTCKDGVTEGWSRTKGTATHFRGIPFAATTAGGNRWLAPQPRATWTEPLDCTVYGEECREPRGALRGMIMAYGKKVSEEVATGRVGDDCLNLNIVTPAIGAKAPVMVWIHGGANTMSGGNGSGLGAAPTCGEGFAAAGIVAVSIHYRQGIHGFSHFPKLGVTNLMLRDVISSLEWVQQNISAFGGDQNNVTLFGESAGAIAISCLLACEQAKPLFHRAIIQSGGISALPMGTWEEVCEKDHVNALMPLLKANGHTELTLEALHSLTGEQMAAAKIKNSLMKSGVVMSPSDFHHVLGDDILPADPYQAIANGSASTKAVLVMATANEAKMMEFMVPMSGCVMPMLASMIGPMAVRGVGIEAYTEADFPFKGSAAIWKDLVSGFQKIGIKSGQKGKGKSRALNYLFGTCGIATTKLVDALLAAPNPAAVYASILEATATESPKLGSGHTLDLFLLFRHEKPEYDRFMAEMLRGQPTFGASLDQLSQNMLRAWCNFATSGSPGNFDGTEWPPMPSHMRMRSTGSVAELSDHAEGSEELKLWKAVCARHEAGTPYFKR